MERAAVIMASGLFVSLIGCGGADTGAPDAAGPAAEVERPTAARGSRPEGVPEVEDPYQERIDEAWEEALAGENPSATCAAVKGRAVSSAVGSAERAVAACNVDIPVRYFLTVADRVEAGGKTCNDLMMAVMTQLPAMTMSMEGLRDLADRSGDADTGDAAAAAAGTAILAGEAAAGGGVNDPRQVVKERLRERVTEVCPQEAGLILR